MKNINWERLGMLAHLVQMELHHQAKYALSRKIAVTFKQILRFKILFGLEMP